MELFYMDSKTKIIITISFIAMFLLIGVPMASAKVDGIIILSTVVLSTCICVGGIYLFLLSTYKKTDGLIFLKDSKKLIVSKRLPANEVFLK